MDTLLVTNCLLFLISASLILILMELREARSREINRVTGGY